MGWSVDPHFPRNYFNRYRLNLVCAVYTKTRRIHLNFLWTSLHVTPNLHEAQSLT